MSDKITWEEAHRRLGVKVGTPLDQVNKAWKMKSKKAHPDVGGSVDAQMRLNEAYQIIRVGRKAKREGLKFSDFRDQYLALKRMVSVGSTDPGELQEAELKLTLRKDNLGDEERMRRIKYARDLLENVMAARENLRNRSSDAFRSRARKALSTQDQRSQMRIQKLQQDLELRKGVKQLGSNLEDRLSKVVKHARVIGKKAHIPFVDRVNGRKVIRYVAITAGVLGAVAAGRWLFSPRDVAFKPKLLEVRK